MKEERRPGWGGGEKRLTERSKCTWESKEGRSESRGLSGRPGPQEEDDLFIMEPEEHEVE